MQHFQTVGLKTVLRKLCVVYAAMKMFERKLLYVPIAVPCFFY